MVAVRGGVEGGPPGGDGEVICGIYLLGLLGTNASAQRWKKRQTLQTRLCYFSQLVLILSPERGKLWVKSAILTVSSAPELSA